MTRWSPLLLIGALAACGDDPAGPEHAFEVVISGPDSVTGLSTIGFTGEPEFHCTIRLTATAHGTAGRDSATWQSATFEWFEPQGSEAYRSIDVPMAEMQPLWGTPSIAADDVLDTPRLRFWSRGPFRLSLVFRYTILPAGGDGSSRFAFDCVE